MMDLDSRNQSFAKLYLLSAVLITEVYIIIYRVCKNFEQSYTNAVFKRGTISSSSVKYIQYFMPVVISLPISKKEKKD